MEWLHVVCGGLGPYWTYLGPKLRRSFREKRRFVG